MLIRLMTGLAYVGGLCFVASLAARSESVIIVCITGFVLVAGTNWLMVQQSVRAFLPERAVSAFALLGLVGAIIVTRESGGKLLSNWFAGAVIVTMVATLAYVFRRLGKRNERTR